MSAPDGLSGARVAAQRQHAARRIAAGHRRGRRAREFFQYLPTTSQSPQPRQWFEGVEDESILRLLDPLDEGKPDLAPAGDLA